MTSDEALRAAMVDRINSWQPLSEAVADAMRKVPRHLFVPDASLKEAYTDDTVVTRRDAEGVATSSASAPWLVGKMLDQLQLRPGMRVLEIGAGTGYNGALISEMVGADGHVTSVEITADVADDARRAHVSAGATNIDVICGDGQLGYAPNAPYDRIVVTAGAWEIPPAWADQLTPDGVLVVPLRMRGLTRSVEFIRDGQVWRSRSAVNCGFMPVTGDGAMPERNIRVAEDVMVRIDDGWDVDAAALERAAAGPGVVEWTGVQIDRPMDLLDFCMADVDGYCRILAPLSIADRGLAEPVNGWGSMGVASAEALGYLTKRADNEYLYELGVCAYGPAAAEAVEALTERVRRWEAARDSVTGVRVEVYPAGEGEAADALMTVDKRHSRVVVRPET
ncbi:MAG: methyltransferase, FxLD system [Stackebrandtia sp.]